MDLSSHGIVALVRNDEGKYLLLEDAREAMQGKWAPPHGVCEQTDESEEKGVVREVYEETGLRVTPIQKIHTQPADTKVKTVSFWLVQAENAENIRLDAESSKYGWLTIEVALRLPLYPGTKTFFENVKLGKILIYQDRPRASDALNNQGQTI